MIIGNPLLLKKAAADSTPADPVTRSLRLASGSSTGDSSSHLDRNSIGTPTDGTKWTFSAWIKRSELTNKDSIFGGGTSSSNWSMLRFRDVSGTEDNLFYDDYTAGSGSHYNWRWTPKFRDPSAFFNLMLVYDASQSVQADKMRLYVNGVLAPSASTYGTSSTTHVMSPSKSGMNQIIGNNSVNDAKANLLIADAYFLDGVAKTVTGGVTDFTELNSFGGLKPKEYTGTDFGNNGFHIDAQPLGSDADLLVSSIDRNDGDTDFADAAKGHTLTSGGDPEHSIAVGNPFTGDGRAIYFDGTGDKIETGSDADFDFGTGDFTIECWFNPSSVSGSGSVWEPLLASNNYTSNGSWVLYQQYDDIYWRGYDGGTYANLVISSVLEANKWYHVAVTRESGTLKIYLNGEEVGSSSSFSSYDFDQSSNLRIGWSYSSYYYKGYMYDVRVVNGTAYTPPSGGPTSKLDDVTNTKLLLQPDKYDSSWVDESGNQTLTGSGDLLTVSPVASTPYDAAAKSTAMYFDGNGDYITTSWDSASDFDFGSSDYTIECWFNVDNTSTTYKTLFSGTAFELNCFLYGSNIYFYAASEYYLYDSTLNNVSTNTWYHVACQRNGNTLELYFNGDLIDTLSWSGTHTSFTSSTPFRIGYLNGYGRTHSGYIYDFRVTKGEAKYTGSTYDTPTAPFQLTPVYLGADQSGNKNHFQPTNISGHDTVLDSPTRNYATLNPIGYIDEGTDPTFAEGNLKITGGTADNKIPSTIAVSSGKWYAEVRVNATANMMMGVAKTSAFTVDGYYLGQAGTDDSWMIYRPTGDEYHNGSNSKFSSGFSTGDILQIALDLDNNKLWWGKNGTWEGTVGTSGETTITAGEYYFAHGYSGGTATWNFGQDNTFAGEFTGTPNNAEFAYEIPTDSSGNPFKSLNTSNLADPTVTPSENFAAAIYEGNNGDEEINLGFTPDLTWIKNRDDDDTYHGLYDSVRGLSEGAIHIQETGAEEGVQRVASFDSDTGSEGFTLASSNYTFTNASGKDYISWNWKAHQTPPTTYNYSTTLTLTVTDYYGTQNYTGWGTTELEVFEGTQSLGTVGQPTGYNTSASEVQTIWEIKTDNSDHSKIKVVWKIVDTSTDSDGSDRFYNIKVVLTDSSSNELASWYPSNYYGGGGFGPDAPEAGDVFRAQTSSADESTTGVLEVQGPTVDPNSEKYNAAAGFTMFTYTGNSSTNNDTMLFNHSLGAPIDFAIGKCRDTPASGTSGGKWVVWHKDLSYDYYSLYLNESESENDVGGDNYDSSGSAGWFANTATGSQHHVKIRNVEIYDGNNYDTVRMVDNSKDFVFYGFTGVESYSKFGSYTGTGSATSPPFIYTGFEIGWLLTKNIDNGSVHWNLHDAARNPHNVVDERVWPNLSYASDSNYDKFDFYSNGFRPVTGDAGHNGNGNTIIYAAFSSSSPFKYANAR